MALGESAILDHGRLVLANVLFLRWFQPNEECACTVVSEGRDPGVSERWDSGAGAERHRDGI